MIGSLPETHLPFPRPPIIISDLSELTQSFLAPELSLCLIDATGTIDKLVASKSLLDIESQDILADALFTFNYVKQLAGLCLRCKSLTLIRLLSRHDDPLRARHDVFQSLISGALRSLQSEHPNLTVTSLTFLVPLRPEYLRKGLKAVINSSVIPSDLYFDLNCTLLCRLTQSLRLGVEDISPPRLNDEWSKIFVFGGASALSLECLRSAVHSGTDIHLFGRRDYDRIYDATPSLRNCTDIRAFVLSEDPKYRKNLQLCRQRISYLSSQVELANAIEDFGSLGASVHYHSCDITNYDALSRKLLDLSEVGIAPTSIIFSAGLLRDSLIVNKSESDFLDVLSVKCVGLLNIFKVCVMDHCRSLYLFGSVSGTYGNKGQTDYSAANEGLYRIAKLFSLSHPQLKTVVFSWGPWAEVGMAKPEVNAQFVRRGIIPLTIEQGVSCFNYLANLSPGGFYAPVCGFAPWNDLESTFNTGLSPDLDSIHQLRMSYLPYGSAANLFIAPSSRPGCTKTYEVNLAHTPLFRDHVLGTQYVIPFAFFVELFLDQCILNEFSREPVHLVDIRCLRGVQVDRSCPLLDISVELCDPVDDGSFPIKIYAGDSSFPNYTARMVAGRHHPSPPIAPARSAAQLIDSLPSPCQCYRDLLFHGSVYQIIDRLLVATASSIHATVSLSGVANDLALATEYFWICPPPLYDSVAQLALIWRHFYDGQIALPSSVSSLVVIHASRLTGRLTVKLVNIHSTDFDMTFDVLIYGIDDELLMYAIGMTCSCSASLSRLNTDWLASVGNPRDPDGAAMLI